MELQNFNDFTSIFILTGLLFIFVFVIKWVAGDFSPVSVDKIDEKEINAYDKQGNIIGKVLVVTYKYTYRDNKVKIKSKKFSI